MGKIEDQQKNGKISELTEENRLLKKRYSKEYDQEIERPFTTILEAYSGPLEFLVGEDGIINSVTSAKCPLTIGDKLVKVNGSAYAGHNLKNRPLILEFCTQRTAGPRL